VNSGNAGPGYKTGNSKFFLVLILLTAAAALVFFLVGKKSHQPPPPPLPTLTPSGPRETPPPAPQSQILLEKFYESLGSMGFTAKPGIEPGADSVTLEGQALTVRRQTFRLPRRFSPGDLDALMTRLADSLGSRLLSAFVENTPEGTSSVFVCAASPGEAVETAFERSRRPKVCLIIDDAGYQKGAALKALYGFKVPVTLSIIPGTAFAKSLAEEAPGRGVEVMCHMPMEGHEKVKKGDYKEFLKKGMDPREAERLVKEALDGLPSCKGLNNHMGSRATMDSRLMEAVCGVLKDRDLFFIDSRTSSRSVAYKTAKQAGLLLAGRDVFLDDKVESRAILRQLDGLVRVSRERGWAVGIGHFKLTTLATLEQAVHRLEAQGVEFVYASEIVASW
jgi:polysaccharide deacetylase 2 family uncharacterized protein YibQ